MVISLPEWGRIYSFRVTAINSGGESFPSETLSAAWMQNDEKPVLIVNAFDRISGPAVFDKQDMAGIAWWEDEGVVYGKDYSHTGDQYNFNRNSEWINDDSQGWGASYADLESTPVNGNTFDFPYIHGQALRDAGYSFVSVSNEVFESPYFRTDDYRIADIIFGEERESGSFIADRQNRDFSVFNDGIMKAISRFAHSKGNVFISGAYIGTDMTENADTSAIRFASEILHYKWSTDHATKTGSVYATDQADKVFPGHMRFNTGLHPRLYKVESPDAIEPTGEGAFCIYRYSSGNCSAGVAYKGLYGAVSLGFPFESILTAEQRAELMEDIIKFFR